MAYFIENFQSWSEAQDGLKTILKIEEERQRCYPYFGLGHAVTDLLYGLKEFWPTRKNIAIMQDGAPILSEAVQGFIREGAKVEFFKRTSFLDVDDWIVQLPRDLLCVVLVRDHCFTGEILTDDSVLAKLNDKRIPFIEVQYGWAWSRSKIPLPFGAQIKVIDSQKAAVLMGTRLKVHPHSAPLLTWDLKQWPESIASAKVQAEESADFVHKFENELSEANSGLKPRFSADQKRLFDRVVVNLDRVNGDFFLEALLASIGEPNIQPAGQEWRMETTNLLRWNGMGNWEWWGPKTLTEAEQRSLIVFSQAWISKVVSPQKLIQIYEDVKKQLNWAARKSG